jgi:hypothetical protein
VASAAEERGSLTAEECFAHLVRYRAVAQCRRCEYLDWALAQLQLVGDYPLAYEAATLRVAPERLCAYPGCKVCPPVDAVLAWLLPDKG